MTESARSQSPAKSLWKAPVYTILAGVLLRAILPALLLVGMWLPDIVVLWLNYLLPCLGTGLLFWSGWTLRNRHPAFKTAACIAILYSSISYGIPTAIGRPTTARRT